MEKLAVLCALISYGISCDANSIAPIRISDLFSRSSEVVLAEVLSGTTEAYQYSKSDPTPWPVCKLKVVEAFKGSSRGDIISLAPCAEMELGGKYILFLEDARHSPEPRSGFKQGSYGVLEHPKQISDAGYGMMHVEYTCLFGGSVPNESCDYGVELNSTQVILPKWLAPSSNAPSTGDEDRYLIREKGLVQLLRLLAEKK
ncbi:MAG TPA: hypothetical protein VFW25_00275 [Silvibacterium sp.]|nr:hypothetical protein [Silvibacterium sp.]